MTPPIRLDLRGGRLPTTLAAQPNDRDLVLHLQHEPSQPARLETDESAYVGQPTTGGSIITVPRHDLEFRLGLLPATLHLAGVATTLTIELLAPAHQAARVHSLIRALADSPLARLAIATTAPVGSPGDEPVSFERLLEAGQLFEQSARLVAARPATRLEERPTTVPPGARLTPNVLAALIAQPYALTPAAPGPGTLPLHGRHYRAGSLQADASQESTDTLENRFLHATGHVIAAALARSRRQLLAQHTTPTPSPGPKTDDYVSLAALTTEHAEARRQRQLDVSAALERNLQAVRALLRHRVPVRHPTLHAHVARLNNDPRYSRARQALDILRQGARQEADLDGLLTSIHSLTTLYELYCLAATHQAIEQLGYTLIDVHHDPTSGTPNNPHLLSDGTPFPNTFTYQHPTLGSAGLLYEPRFSRTPHPTAQLATILRTTETLTPDLVLVAPGRALVFDAKFTPHPPTERLPNAVMRYLHGLHDPSGDITLAGLFLLHYSPDAEALSHHHTDGITPAIGTLPVHPDAHTHALLDVLHHFLDPITASALQA